MTASIADRVREHVRIPLYREGYALMLSTAITSLLGLVYWIAAARAYRPEVVGLNSAAISAMLFLSGLAQLNLSSALIRFLPTAGLKTRQLIVGSYATTMVAAAIAGTAFLIGVRTWSPSLAFLASTPGFAVWFVLSVVAWGVFVMQDAVLTGFRRAIWVTADAAIFATVKLVLLLIFAGTFANFGIFASWTAAMVASILPINALILLRLMPARARAVSDAPGVTRRALTRYAFMDYLGWLGFLSATTLLPLMITERAGGAANAYYSLAWALVMPLYLLSSNMGMSLVVSAAVEEVRLQPYVYRTVVQTLRLVGPLVAGAVLLGPYVLQLVGGAYAAHATDALRLLALSAIPNVITTVYVYSWRAQRKMPRVAGVLATLCVIVCGLGYWLLDVWGIAGVGAAWLIGQAIVASVILITNMASLIRGRAEWDLPQAHEVATSDSVVAEPRLAADEPRFGPLV